MDKEILKKVLEQIEQSGSDQLLILAGMFIGVILINLLQAIYTSRIVDKYKNELKKQEVKFSVYNQIQIEKLSLLFEVSHDHKFSASTFVGLSKKSLSDITDLHGYDITYEALSDCYSRNRYIFPKEIKDHIQSDKNILSDFELKISFLITKNEILSCNEDEDQKDRISNLELIESEIGGYNFEKGSLEVMFFCESLKVLIENHFEEWE